MNVITNDSLLHCIEKNSQVMCHQCVILGHGLVSIWHVHVCLCLNFGNNACNQDQGGNFSCEVDNAWIYIKPIVLKLDLRIELIFCDCCVA